LLRKPITMNCPYCHEEINDDASRCKHCSGELALCQKCGRRVAVTTKNIFTGLARGATQEQKKCATCGSHLGGPQCFVATAAFGTPDAWQVDMLRTWRDLVLLPTRLGRFAVAAYYYIGPHLARFIEDSPRLRKFARITISPFVCLAKWQTSKRN
jgi:hypothetical protein